MRRARHTQDKSQTKQKEAEDTLLTALGLADWKPPEPLSYTARVSAAFAAGRLDAQYYMPANEQVMHSLAALPGKALGDRVDNRRDMFDPDRVVSALHVRNYDSGDFVEILSKVE